MVKRVKLEEDNWNQGGPIETGTHKRPKAIRLQQHNLARFGMIYYYGLVKGVCTSGAQKIESGIQPHDGRKLEAV